MSARFAKTFEDLDVFKKAFSFSVEVHKASLEFPKIEQFALADQIRRCSKSICANIAEGFGKQRGSAPEFRRYLLMALGSSDEMQVWIRYCQELNYVTTERAMLWRENYQHISRMLQSLYSKNSDNR